jgi:hypothetical protein
MYTDYTELVPTYVLWHYPCHSMFDSLGITVPLRNPVCIRAPCGGEMLTVDQSCG